VTGRLRAYVVDDEPLAVRRLARMLAATGRVDVAGTATDPREALAWLSRERVDALFVDIQMPGLTGLELCARLPEQPMIVFVTAYDDHALAAFELNSIDYLLKPVDPRDLDRAVGKLERLRAGPAAGAAGVADALARVSEALRTQHPPALARIASRVGDRISLIDLADITHFFADDKLTSAATAARTYVVDATIAELERKLDPARWLRIHRATLVNLAFVDEIHALFAGRAVVRLKDGKRTELPVARARVTELRRRLGV
jgi:two-component system LytT family response regulator